MNVYALTVRVAVTAITDLWFCAAQHLPAVPRKTRSSFAEAVVRVAPQLTSNSWSGGRFPLLAQNFLNLGDGRYVAIVLVVQQQELPIPAAGTSTQYSSSSL